MPSAHRPAASLPAQEPAPLKRHFVTVNGRDGPRQVHYRSGGRGPVVLLLHQSPQSSREMEPLIQGWGNAFTLIAPDSPGYGCSEPLRRNGQPKTAATMEELAAATLEFADALGLGRFGIYGFHTGASIAMALAHRHPHRVAAVAGNGLVILTAAERAAILRDYLPALEPRWDGGHLAWLWGRLREQTIFFPWHDRRAATRMSFAVPPADRLQAGLLDFLAASEHYAVAYTAAFTDQAERRLPELTVPVLITAAARDPLAAHLGRIGARSGSVRIVPASDPADALDQALRHLTAHPGDEAVATPSNHDGNADPAALRIASEYLGEPGRQVRLVRTRSRPAATGRPVILLHPVAGAAVSVQELASALANWSEVLAVDLPGHGASDAPAMRTGALADTVAQLAAALAPVARQGAITVLGVGNSAPVAIELARRLEATARLILLGVPAWSTADKEEWLNEGLPPLTPVWAGGHLLEAWHLVRDSRLYSPWFRRNPSGIRPGEPDLGDGAIHREVHDLLRANGAWQALLRDALRYAESPEDPAGPPVTRLAQAPASWADLLAPGRPPGPP